MELQINIELNQILNFIRQLPAEKKLLIKKEIEKSIKNEGADDTDMTKLLLSGPIMTDEELENYKKLRKHFNSWQRRISA